jgi:hypothetical protein
MAEDTETASEIAELETQLRVLKQARASGVYSVRHGDTSVQYRSLKEINAAISSIQREIRLLRGQTRTPKYVLQTTRGL